MEYYYNIHFSNYLKKNYHMVPLDHHIGLDPSDPFYFIVKDIFIPFNKILKFSYHDTEIIFLIVIDFSEIILLGKSVPI